MKCAKSTTVGYIHYSKLTHSIRSAQVFFVILQNRKKSKLVMLREVLFVLCFVKPGVDAFRVATGKEDNESPLNYLQELTIIKSIEMACESIPGCLLQVFTFIVSPHKTLFHVISIIISSGTTGFGAAMVSFMADASVRNRQKAPMLYGFLKVSEKCCLHN